MKTHRNLEVWNKSVELVTEIYKVTESFPKSELYGLTNQIRRSAVSIPSNIAEGAARASSKELLQFLSVALGSVAELETQLIVSGNLNFIDKNHLDLLLSQIVTIRKMITGLKKSIST